jgi:hypothetical protein
VNFLYLINQSNFSYFDWQNLRTPRSQQAELQFEDPLDVKELIANGDAVASFQEETAGLVQKEPQAGLQRKRQSSTLSAVEHAAKLSRYSVIQGYGF